MNQSALKTFAQDARNKLRQLIGARLDYVLTADTAELRQQAAQVNELRTALNNEGRDPLIERVAYTWFNRLAALRFMDANGYHPFGARVITPATANETLPEVLQQARAGALDADLRASIANPKTFDDLLAGRIPVDHPEAQVFKLLLVAACNYYHRLMPFLFEKIGDATELLLPDDLLTEHSIVADFRENLTDEDCQNEEVLGWFYQYYISEKKDEVMGRNAAVPKQDIPAVTQLFTPHWIVRYLVENSLGRLWLLNRPQSKLREKMPYYIDDAAAATSALTKIWQQPDESKRQVFPPRDPSFLRVFDGEFARLPEDATIEEIWLLALSIDGYKLSLERGWGECRDLYARKKEEYRRTGRWEGSIEELWCTLFFYQRDWRWSEWPKEFPELPMVRSLYTTLRQRLMAARIAATDVSASALQQETGFLKITKPEDIRLLDPAGGSGHMLTYAFDLLYAIYEEEGYDAPEIPGLILRHNLYGVDICDRAVALAAFALCMKARAKDNRFFRRVVQPHLISLQEIRFEEGELREYIRALNLGELFNQPMLKLLHQFEEAKNFGALIQPCLDEKGIGFARGVIEAKDIGGQLFLRETHAKVLRVLEQAEYLCRRYHFVVANPPYMGSGGMNVLIKTFAKKQFPDSKSDLFAMFIERATELAFHNGYAAMVTMQGWMFLSSYEVLREKLLSNTSLVSLIQIGFNSFPEMNSKVARACAFVLRNAFHSETGSFINLNNAPQSADKETVFFERINKNELFHANAEAFKKIPGSPIAYWLSEATFRAFEKGGKLGDLGDVKTGMSTTDNERFVRFWHELGIGSTALKGGSKWFPYNKGGGFRKWYGNLSNFVNWADDGREIKEWVVNNPSDPDTTHWSRRIFNTEYFHKRCVTWGDISSGPISARHLDCNAISDSVGIGFYATDSLDHALILQLLNSKVASVFTEILCPTVHFNPGAMVQIPVFKAGFADLSQECISMAQSDWDNFETSWDFRGLPLLRSGLKGPTLAASWQNWKAHCDAAIRRMQELETENNRLFIAAYGLQDELKPEVPEDQITLARADARKDMVAFLSYAVGCMFGRYSLDAPGLILADAGATVQDYLKKVPQPTFEPDADGILPVLDGEWFTDDIVARVREFLRVTFGEDTLAENIAFIETALGKVDAKTGKVKPADLRTFLARDFYKEHVRTYKKRPIYWMFSSPESSFQALIYLHRYTRDTVNLLLNDYVREFIGKLEEKHRQLTAVTLNESARPGDRTKAAKELVKIAKMLKEIQAWEHDVLLPLAQQRIELDLDDGVKVNYLKFKGAVVNIPGLEKKEED